MVMYCTTFSRQNPNFTSSGNIDLFNVKMHICVCIFFTTSSNPFHVILAVCIFSGVAGDSHISLRRIKFFMQITFAF